MTRRLVPFPPIGAASRMRLPNHRNAPPERLFSLLGHDRMKSGVRT